jgi:hypothetical protein
VAGPTKVKKIENLYALNPMPKVIAAETLIKEHKKLMQYLDRSEAFRATLRRLPAIVEADDDAYIGIEIEVEKVGGSNWTNTPAGWQVTKDGSLRNSGAEFISAPLEPKSIRSAIAAMYLSLRYGQKTTVDFSWRTSIHFHLNVRTLTPSQLATLLLTYLAFEELFFHFAGEDRARGNFAVPIHDTDFDMAIARFVNGGGNVADLVSAWHKYSALNLVCVTGSDKGDDSQEKTKKGTVEFRHLGGTKELSKLVLWSNLILCLHKFSRTTDLQDVKGIISNIKTVVQYNTFKTAVFGEMGKLFPNPSRIPNLSLSYAKGCLTEMKYEAAAFTKTGLAEMLAKRYSDVEHEALNIDPNSSKKKVKNQPSNWLDTDFTLPT